MTPQGAVLIAQRRTREYLERKREKGQALPGTPGVSEQRQPMLRGVGTAGQDAVGMQEPALAPLSPPRIVRALSIVALDLALVVASWAGVWGLWRAVLWLGR